MDEAERIFLYYLRRNQDTRQEWLKCLEDKIVAGKSMDDIRKSWAEIMKIIHRELVHNEEFGPIIP